MTFVDSIKTCFTKYADFSGRATRSEFWWFMLFNMMVAIPLMFIHDYLYGAYWLAVLLPNIAVAARRLHDTDRSGWMQLLFLIPLIGLIVIFFYVQEGKEPNRFGPAPAN